MVNEYVGVCGRGIGGRRGVQGWGKGHSGSGREGGWRHVLQISSISLGGRDPPYFFLLCQCVVLTSAPISSLIHLDDVSMDSSDDD